MITIVVVIATATAVVIRSDAKIKAMGEIVNDLKVAIEKHVDDEDQHIGKRLFAELMRRLAAADNARERMEAKIDDLILRQKR